MILKYSGSGVDDGTILAKDLICGIRGVSILTQTIYRQYNPKSKVNLKIHSFNKGSFLSLLAFIESHPVLFTSGAVIIAGVITGIIKRVQINKITFQEMPTELFVDPNINKEASDIIFKLLENPQKKKKVGAGLHYLVRPLHKEKIERLTIGEEKNIAEIDHSQKDYFYSNDTEERIHKSIELVGKIRSLDKKTNRGKFVDEKGCTYSFALIMEDPEVYYVFYVEEKVKIFGVATINKITQEIENIEIENIITQST